MLKFLAIEFGCNHAIFRHSHIQNDSLRGRSRGIGVLELYISNSVSLLVTDTIRLTFVSNSGSPGCGEVKAAPRKQGSTALIVPLFMDSFPCQCTYCSSRFQPKSTFTLQRTISPSGISGNNGPLKRAMHFLFLTMSI